MTEQDILNLLSSNLTYILLAILIFVLIFRGIKIVPQSEQHVVERFGRLRSVLGPGINFIVPFLDKVRHRISILERQLPTASQDAITKDNVLVQVDTSVFYRITQPEKTVYRIRDVDAAIATTVAGIVRAEIGKMDLDEVQATRDAMLQQLNAERARRAQVTEAEGQKRSVELQADAELYAAEQTAKARRVQADAEAYATGVVAKAIADNGLEAAQYQVALKQVEALNALGAGPSSQTVIVPAQALEAFGNAFNMLKGKS